MQKAISDILFLQACPQDKVLRQNIAQTDLSLLWFWMNRLLMRPQLVQSALKALPPEKIILIAKKYIKQPIAYTEFEFLLISAMHEQQATSEQFYQLQHYLHSSFSRYAVFGYFDAPELQKYIRNNRNISDNQEALALVAQAKKLSFSSAELFQIFLAIELRGIRSELLFDFDLAELKFGVFKAELAKWG